MNLILVGIFMSLFIYSKADRDCYECFEGDIQLLPSEPTGEKEIKNLYAMVKNLQACNKEDFKKSTTHRVPSFKGFGCYKIVIQKEGKNYTARIAHTKEACSFFSTALSLSKTDPCTFCNTNKCNNGKEESSNSASSLLTISYFPAIVLLVTSVYVIYFEYFDSRYF